MQPLQQQNAGYDRAITVFSPDGRLFQVEYAREAVKRGTTSLGLKSKEGVVLIVDKRTVSRLVEAKSIEKIFQIDNHIGAAGGVKEAVQMAQEYAPFVRKIEVECETLDMVKEAVEAGADIIMVDNMDKETMKEAIRIIDGRAKTECSGNVTKENVANLIDIGVDYISSGALTHSAPIMDLSLKNLHRI